MLLPAHTHQRRAAYAVLQPVLGNEDSVQALAWLHERLASDSVADVIGFIDAVATRHRLDDLTRRRLYASLHATLRQPADTLPPDPLAAMQAAQAHTAGSRAWQATTRPMARWPALPVPAAPSTASAAASSEADEPLAARAVFATLMNTLLEGLSPLTQSRVRAAGLVQFERAAVSPITRETACAAWHQAGPQAWALPGSVDELSELVHRVYLALCEVCGPEPADALLGVAARAAVQSPHAQACPPGRLL